MIKYCMGHLVHDGGEDISTVENLILCKNSILLLTQLINWITRSRRWLKETRCHGGGVPRTENWELRKSGQCIRSLSRVSRNQPSHSISVHPCVSHFTKLARCVIVYYRIMWMHLVVYQPAWKAWGCESCLICLTLFMFALLGLIGPFWALRGLI